MRPTRVQPLLVLFAVLCALCALEWVDAGNTTCLTDEMDWYTNVVGETPCRTYERLRQLCDAQCKPNATPSSMPICRVYAKR